VLRGGHGRGRGGRIVRGSRGCLVVGRSRRRHGHGFGSRALWRGLGRAPLAWGKGGTLFRKRKGGAGAVLGARPSSRQAAFATVALACLSALSCGVAPAGSCGALYHGWERWFYQTGEGLRVECETKRNLTVRGWYRLSSAPCPERRRLHQNDPRTEGDEQRPERHARDVNSDYICVPTTGNRYSQITSDRLCLN